MNLRLFLLFCWLCLLPISVGASAPLRAADAAGVSAVWAADCAPVEPILPAKKSKKSKLKFKAKQKKGSEMRPIWDILLLYIILGGALLLPFALVAIGWGVAAALAGLWVAGAVVAAILALVLLFFYLSLRRNLSTSDAWIERYSWRLAVAVVALAALAVFIGGLIAGALLAWVLGLVGFVALAGLLVWLQLR